MTTPITIEQTVSRPTFSPDVERRIEEGWQALVSRDPRLFNGTLLRVLNASDPTMVSAKVVPDIGYREVVGLRGYKDFQDWVPANERFQVLSAIAFVETADGNILLRERNSGDWEHSLELPGGFIVAKDAPASVEEFIRERIADDLSVPIDAIASLERIGNIDFKSICESMFVFKIKLTVSFDELKPESPFHVMPAEYTPQKHESYFSLPLHSPTREVLERFLEVVVANR